MNKDGRIITAEILFVVFKKKKWDRPLHFNTKLIFASKQNSYSYKRTAKIIEQDSMGEGGGGFFSVT